MNIQIVQGLSIGEGKINSANGKITTESDLSPQKIKLPEAQEKKILSDNSDSSKEQSNPVEIFYPPFFPMGNTQGIYSVLNQTNKDSSSLDSKEKQKVDNSINVELIAAQQEEKVALDEGEKIKNNEPEAQKAVSPGSVLDLNV
ncbi:MAG: hypothetical protein ABFD66_02540 [Smithella sp.]